MSGVDTEAVYGDDETAPEEGSGFYRLLGRVELHFAQVCVVLMTLLVLLSAIARTAGNPLSWTVDLATFTFAWAVFVGADVAWRRDRMVSIDLLLDRLPVRAQAWVRLLNHALTAAFLVTLAYTGLRLSYTASDRSFSGLPWLSYTWVTIAVPVGSLLMLYTTAHKVRHAVAVARGQVREAPS